MPTSMIPCKFFAQGLCKNGNACKFRHEQHTMNEPAGATIIHPGANSGDRPAQLCTFYIRNACTKGEQCRFTHSPRAVPSLQAQSDLNLPENNEEQQNESLQNQDTSQPPELPPDSRAEVKCKFSARSGGCQNASCPYLHPVEVDPASDNDDEDEDQELGDDFTRNLLGASVYFNEFGHVQKVSLPTDYSIACITGLKGEDTPESISTLLQGLGFRVKIDCIRVIRGTAPAEIKATVKMEDPHFAKDLSTKLKDKSSTLSASSIPAQIGRTNCRKLRISWHKASRTVWLNFGNGAVAKRVAQKFNKAIYTCHRRAAKPLVAQETTNYGQNFVAWTIILSDVPGGTTREDVMAAIKLSQDRPRHVELGPASYQATDEKVSDDIRERLEKYGQLGDFYLTRTTSKEKRMKAIAWFQDEANAKSAFSLNGQSLHVLNKGKITVALVQTIKIKIRTAIYLSVKDRIDKESKAWKEQHFSFNVYSDPAQRYKTLKLECENTQSIVGARKTLDEISKGVVLSNGKDPIWSLVLGSNGNAYRKLQLIATELNVVIDRSKLKRQLQYYGPTDKFQQTVGRVSHMLEEESYMNYEINLQPSQFSSMIQGGYKRVEQTFGKDTTIFDVVSRKILVKGTQQLYDRILATINNKDGVEVYPLPEGSLSAVEEPCPICFCEADTPVHASCKHIYCLECFEGYCKSAASAGTYTTEFGVKCQGDSGTCPTIFSLRELQDHLSSTAFETVLLSYFQEHIQRHPDAFRYCPTPDCGYIYRCTTTIDMSTTSSQARSINHQHTCPNCLESICTSCHARHGEHTCAEYKDIASGGYQALEKLKRQLNIKDCPRCSTSMEKTEGCNHMTCAGCKAHICWVCMTVFDTSGPCYEHMTEAHGGIGILDPFMFD